MNYILFRNADGNTGYMSQHGNGGGSKSAHGNTGHHIDVPAELYAYGNGGGHPREPGGIQGGSVKRMYFHHKLRYTVK
ncbi:hypothetical protein [Bacillus mycoides]|uniref:hypothetical protein n=1 Tax=Bacillus mycoides TaxID=1405 RepID=UPI0002799B97|nr:hypothetical protein [Bacillus mycoides]EJR94321.1 hypothetical protein IKM_05626 [Bacillus mycoides]